MNLLVLLLDLIWVYVCCNDDNGVCAGPGTVFCDNLSYIFMFLSIATSNMVATSLAKKVRHFTKMARYCFEFVEP